MTRELNKSLFDSVPGAPAGPETAILSPTAVATSAVQQADRQVLVIQIENLKKKIKTLEGRVDKSEGHIEALTKATKLKLEQSGSRLERMEQYIRSTVTDLAEKFSTLSGRITNSRLSEEKVEALLNRQNQMIQNFETRLMQMQKLIGDQEMQLHSYKSALEEARAQLGRMHRAQIQR